MGQLVRMGNHFAGIECTNGQRLAYILILFYQTIKNRRNVSIDSIHPHSLRLDVSTAGQETSLSPQTRNASTIHL
jgi:hypothetical protein